MERGAVLERLTPRRVPLVWRIATVIDVRPETARARTIVLNVPDWPGHQAGQHLDVRLTVEDGYQAQRSYSIASAPENEHIELTVERIDDGEVSQYLCDELRAGDDLELRGPIGGYFTWQVADGGPLLLLGGGSGVVPLVAMLRHRAAHASRVDTRLLLSAGTRDDIWYRDELDRLGRDGVAVHYTLTRAAPPSWSGWSRRVDAAMVREAGPEPPVRPRAFVCGPTPFVERVADLLVELGHDPKLVKTERFGPTGG
jgi:ferredoxin-NADP reductase